MNTISLEQLNVMIAQSRAIARALSCEMDNHMGDMDSEVEEAYEAASKATEQLLVLYRKMI